MPRELTDAQKAAIATAIEGGGTAHILVNTDVDDAVGYAAQLSDVFTGAGWNIIIDTPDHVWPNTSSGLVLVAQGDLPLTGIQQAFLQAAAASELPINQLDGMLAEHVDLKFMVGREGV